MFSEEYALKLEICKMKDSLNCYLENKEKQQIEMEKRMEMLKKENLSLVQRNSFFKNEKLEIGLGKFNENIIESEKVVSEQRKEEIEIVEQNSPGIHTDKGSVLQNVDLWRLCSKQNKNIKPKHFHES